MHLEWYQLCTFLGRLEKIFTQIFSVVCGAKMRNPAGKSCLGASHRDCLCCFPTSFLPSLPKALNTPSHVPAHLTSESCGCFGRGKLYLSWPLKKRRNGSDRHAGKQTVFFNSERSSRELFTPIWKRGDSKKYFCLQKTNTSSLKSENTHSMCMEWQANNI